MISNELVLILSSVISSATPLVLAAMGETLTEKSGVINLSLDGSILLCAMIGFVVAFETNNVLIGFLCAGTVGALIAAFIVFLHHHFDISQVAAGFILTLTTKELAYFLGNAYSRIPGPQIQTLPFPLLQAIPVCGPVFLQHNLLVYFSYFSIFLLWWVFNRSYPGLVIRAVGEDPIVSFRRGLHPKRTQMLSASVGGLLVGFAGAAFSLYTKPGWGRPQGAEGMGWIVLALVIFGGWHPVKAAIGAYFFSFLQIISIHLQDTFSSLPAQVFQTAPFPLMIFLLLITNQMGDYSGKLGNKPATRLKRILSFLYGNQPAGLGKSFCDIYDSDE